MPFYTTLHYYRPTEPPRITGDSLAEFVADFEGLKVTEIDGPLTIQVKFGESIDQDERSAEWQEPVYETISVVREIDWDLEVQCPSLRAVADALAGHDRPVYRSFLQLGNATKDISGRLARLNSSENEVDLYLDQWSMEIGPVMSFDLGSEDQYLVGWVSVGLSGYGYLYPWTFAELVRRAEGHPDIGRVADLCRATWPVDPEQTDRRQKRLRRQMGDLWPYPEVGLPWGWYWGLSESD